MGSVNSKAECIWLPGQSGKTRTVQNIIRQYRALSLSEGAEGFINIVICSNNRALVKQTGARMETDLYKSDEEDEDADAKIDGSVFNWFSGLKNNNISYETLGFRILKNINMVIVCAHKLRIKYVRDLLLDLEAMEAFTKRINIWIDEADDTVKLWSKPEFDITPLSKVHRVFLVSATFDSIIAKYERIRVMPKEETYPTVYHRVQDCCVVEDDSGVGKGLTAVDYLTTIYAKYKSVLCVPGMRLFAPGDIAKKTHDAILDFLLAEGFAVAILNGDRKEIVLPGKETPIPLNLFVDGPDGVPEEVGKKIAALYEEYDLKRYPFAITGHLCIGRGLTFQNSKFLFDWGIVPIISDAAAAYQCACRLAGNIKGLPGYKQSMLITPSETMAQIRREETLAIRVAKMVFDLKLEDVGEENLHEVLSSVFDEETYRRKEVPVVIPTTIELVEHIHGLSSEEKQKAVRHLLKRVNPELAKQIKRYSCRKISCPKDVANESYQTNIVRAALFASKKLKYNRDMKEDEKGINSWIAFLDKFEGRIIVMVYHGEA